MKKKSIEIPKRQNQTDVEYEILPPERHSMTFSSSSRIPSLSQGQAAGKWEPAHKIQVFTNVLDCITDVTSSVSAVLIKRQETKQMREQTKMVELSTQAAIETQREMTKRLRIEQTEETDRMKWQVMSELKALQTDLIKFQEELAVKQEEARQNHIREMEELAILERSLDLLRKAYEEYSQLVLDIYRNGNIPPASLEQALRKTENELVVLTQTISAQRG